MAKAESQKSLDSWTKEDWGTKSGKNSTQGKNATGERYLPKKAREALTDEEYKQSTAKKRAAATERSTVQITTQRHCSKNCSLSQVMSNKRQKSKRPCSSISEDEPPEKGWNKRYVYRSCNESRSSRHTRRTQSLCQSSFKRS